MNGGGEGKANIHAAGVFLYWAIHELADLGKSYYIGENCVDLATFDAHYLAV